MKFLHSILILIGMLVPSFSEARPKLIELKEAYVDYMHYGYAREPFFLDGQIPTSRLDINFNLDFLNRIVYLNNMVHSETDQSQYRKIGWNYRFGIHIWDILDLYFEHFSQHLLDAVPVSRNTYDAVGVRVYIFRR